MFNLLLSERINHIMEAWDIRHNTVIAKVSGVTPMSVAYWRDGTTREIKAKYAIPIAKKWGYNSEWLMTGEGPMHPSDESRVVAYSSHSDEGVIISTRIMLLRNLIDKLFEGNASAFSRHIDRSPAQVHQWLSGYRTLGDGALRNIEMTVKDLPIGYFDERPRQSKQTLASESNLLKAKSNLAEFSDEVSTQRYGSAIAKLLSLPASDFYVIESEICKKHETKYARKRK